MSSLVPLPPVSAVMVEVDWLCDNEPVDVNRKKRPIYCGKCDQLYDYLPQLCTVSAFNINEPQKTKGNILGDGILLSCVMLIYCRNNAGIFTFKQSTFA